MSMKITVNTVAPPPVENTYDITLTGLTRDEMLRIRGLFAWASDKSRPQSQENTLMTEIYQGIFDQVRGPGTTISIYPTVEMVLDRVQITNWD